MSYLTHRHKLHAGVAQWQSSSFVMSRLGVRFPSPAPQSIKNLLVFSKGFFYLKNDVIIVVNINIDYYEL